MKDRVFADMIVIPQEDSAEPTNEDELMIHRIVGATADAFSRLSFLMREIREDLPEDLRVMFREIVGAAARAHGDVISEALPEECRRFMHKMAESLTTRAINSINKRHEMREAGLDPDSECGLA